MSAPQPACPWCVILGLEACCNEHGDYICTRPANHSGEHIWCTRTKFQHDLARWPNESEAVRPNPDFPAWLRESRIRLGLTRLQMARLCGISFHTWCNWSSGAVEPDALYRAHAEAQVRLALLELEVRA